MKVLVINAGSSSLKYQLIDMDSEKVLAKGNCERIGQEGAFIGFKAPDGTKIERKTEMVNHTQAFEAVKDALLDPQYGAIKDLSEVSAIGHRVVQGGSYFNKSVLVTDDVVSSENIPDRRGIAGDFFVFKVAGAKAATGADLDEVVAAAQKANDNTRSMGVAMSSATLPAKGGTIFDMEDGDMEIGMGIHGEPGIRGGKIDTADNVIDEIMEPILKDLPYVEGDEVCVLVNSLGATPLIDLHVCYRRVAQILEEKGIKVYKALVGPFACSMDMAGMSVTLMKLDDELKELMDAPCDTPYFTQK